MIMQEHKTAFKARVQQWAEKLDIEIRSVAVRQMRNKWASCSTNGYLVFNAELLNLEEDLGDYVIVHELLHFFVPNHGKLWKSLMLAHLGDYETLESEHVIVVLHEDEAKLLEPYVKALAKFLVDEVQEIFTRSFDVQSITTLSVGTSDGRRREEGHGGGRTGRHQSGSGVGRRDLLPDVIGKIR